MIWPIFFPTESHPFNLWNYWKQFYFKYIQYFCYVFALSPICTLLPFTLLWLSSEFPWFCVASIISSSFLCMFLYPFCRFCRFCILFCVGFCLQGHCDISGRWCQCRFGGKSLGERSLNPSLSKVSWPHCEKLNPLLAARALQLPGYPKKWGC